VVMDLAAMYEERCSTPSDIVAHLPRFVALCAELDATSVIELGTRTGVSTIAWLYALEGKGELISIDLDARPPIGEWDHWTFIQGSDMDPAIVAGLPKADIVFIDTSHLYEHTVAELDIYIEHVRPGGRIVLHDTQLRRPEGSPPLPVFPVRKAIAEFAEARDLIWHEYRDCYGLGIIEVP
jgi:cephalosporin hydroxylase